MSSHCSVHWHVVPLTAVGGVGYALLSMWYGGTTVSGTEDVSV